MSYDLRSFATLRRAGVTFFGELGAWAYDTWAAHNGRYFDGALGPGPILWGLTPHGHRLGAYAPARNAITLHPSLLRPSGDAWRKGDLLGERYASDVLLHEMIHQKLHQVDRYDGAESHNCPEWCAEITRLSAMLGLECRAQPVKVRRARDELGGSHVTRAPLPGFLRRGQIATWPYSIRPRDYYEADTASLRERYYL